MSPRRYSNSLSAPRAQDGQHLALQNPRDELRGATLYAYRVEGPDEPRQGHRFDPQRVLLDPFAQSVFFPPGYSRETCSKPGPTDGKAPLGRLPKQAPNPAPLEAGPRHEIGKAIVYELHVKGYTARNNSGVAAAKRGTFAGLQEKIPYLKDLGGHHCRAASHSPV
jgi:glycogen operon protein